LQKEVAQLLSRNQSLEKDITGWKQNVESLENTNFDLQERLVAIGSLVEAVRSEIYDYCPHSEEIVGEGEKEVLEEAEVDFRLQGNAIEGRLQLVMTGCSRIAEDLATLQHERDELQMVSTQLSCMCTQAILHPSCRLSLCVSLYLPVHNLPPLLSLPICFSLTLYCSFCHPILFLPASLPHRAWRPHSSSLTPTQRSLPCSCS